LTLKVSSTISIKFCRCD